MVAKLIHNKLRPVYQLNRAPHHMCNFFAQFQQYANYACLNYTIQAITVGKLLTDKAAPWYQGLASAIPNFTEFHQLFLHRWGDPLEEENAQKRLITL